MELPTLCYHYREQDAEPRDETLSRGEGFRRDPGSAAMSISREEVEHVAHLARLGLTEEEKDLFQVQLSDILQHVAMINQLDTEAIPPTAQVIPLQNVMRDDVAAPCCPPEEILANAPRVEGHYFRIPPVLEEQEAELDGPPDI